MKKRDSIQDTLLSMGFKTEEGHFVKDEVKIPFDQIIGHSVDSFLEKAKRREWIQEGSREVGKSMLLEPGILCDGENKFILEGSQIRVRSFYLSEEQKKLVMKFAEVGIDTNWYQYGLGGPYWI